MSVCPADNYSNSLLRDDGLIKALVSSMDVQADVLRRTREQLEAGLIS